MSHPLYYSQNHVWASAQQDGTVAIGISDHAQEMLGDIVFVEPPKVGDQVSIEVACGLVESVKTASDIFSPIRGIVTKINEALQNTPELLNEHPETTWIANIKPDSDVTWDHLMNAEAYSAFIK